MTTKDKAPLPVRPGPLSGVRILDLTTVVLGPMATQMLGDLGAEIIKIETPAGDLMRANGVSRSSGMSSIYLAINRNKESIAVDLKTKEGADIALALIKDADALVHNMRVAAIERLGIGYDAARAVNPGLVYCAATGYGQDGPYAAKPAFDDIIQAASGLASLSTGADGEPTYSPTLIADKTAAMAVSNAVLAALFHRERTGEGQYIEVPMFETMVAFNLAEHMGGLSFVPPCGKAGYARITQGGRRPTRTADGHIAFLPYTPAHWARLFRRLDREDLINRYEIGGRDALNRHVRSLYQELGQIAPQRTTREWLDLCEELDIPATSLYPLDDLPDHPHAQAVDLFVDAIHPTEGAIRYVRPATRFSATPASVRCHAPRLGEQSRDILSDLGYDSAHIDHLLTTGIVVEN